MRVDLHVHTSGMSDCASADYRETVGAFSSVQMDFVLTNHYNFLYIKDYGGRYDRENYARLFVEEYYRTRDEGQRANVKVFFGIEVALCLPDCPYAEFLLYGAEPEFLLKNPNIYELDQRQLYELANENGLVVIQSHPYRIEQGHFPHDPTFMDGVEINCHYRFLREEEKVRKFAAENNLIVTAGSDFHKLGQEGSAILIMNDDIVTSAQLGEAIKKEDFKIWLR